MTTVTGAGKAARRRDAGVPRLTERDLWALTRVGEQYGMRVDQLARLLGRRAEGTTNRNGILTGRRVRKVVERWERAGLVQARKVFHTDPMWVWLTRAGLRAVDLEAKFLEPSAMLLRHIFWCAEVRLRLDADYDDLIWRSDRILKAFGTGRTDQHLADAETKFDGTVRAIEVELTPKTWMRTKEIMDILAGAYPEVWYYVAPPAADLVRHIVGDLKPEHQAKFRVIDLATLTPGHPR